MPAEEIDRHIRIVPSDLLAAGLRPLPSTAGSFFLEEDALWFTPRFPFRDGLDYSVLIDELGGTSTTLSIQRPAAAGAPVTSVVAVYPSSAVVPLNLLRIYVQFSSPMSEGRAERSLQMLRADTRKPLPGVFLRMVHELWDSGRRRLTVLLDPGRIKRGLVPNAEDGYPLSEGVPVVFRVDERFEDSSGRTLTSSFERAYDIGPPLRSKVSPDQWRLDPPNPGSQGPLSVYFDRPMDRGLLAHCLRVETASGERVLGDIAVGDGELSWSFRPHSAWRPGGHRIVVDTKLEDVAGNSIRRVFDRDLDDPDNDPIEARTVSLPFTV